MKVFMQDTLSLGLAFCILGCGGTAYPDLVKRRAEVTALKAEETRLSNRLKRFQRLKKQMPTHTRLVLTKSAVGKILSKFHPHSAAGEKLSKKHLRGVFSLSNPQDLKFLGPDRVRYRATFSGKQVKVSLKGVPFVGKKEERALKSALTSGAKVVIETRLRIDRKRGALWLDSDCLSVTLKTQNTQRNRDYLKESLNKKIFNVPKVVPLPKALKGKRTHVFVANDGVVIGIND